MISSIAVDKEYIYYLDTGQIRRRIIVSNKIDDPMVGPNYPSAVIQLMTTNKWLYVLCADGAAFRVYGDDEHYEWESYPVPANTTWLASNDTHIITISGDRIYRQSFYANDTWVITPAVPGLTGLIQVDYDEDFGYVTAGDDVYYQQFPNDALRTYPEPLSDVQSVVAGTDYVYALTLSGEVYRSQTIGHSGWELYGGGNKILIAISSDHKDRIFMVDSNNQICVVNKFEWTNNAVLDGWIVETWVDPDWIHTAP